MLLQKSNIKTLKGRCVDVGEPSRHDRLKAV